MSNDVRVKVSFFKCLVLRRGLGFRIESASRMVSARARTAGECYDGHVHRILLKLLQDGSKRQHKERGFQCTDQFCPHAREKLRHHQRTFPNLESTLCFRLVYRSCFQCPACLNN